MLSDEVDFVYKCSDFFTPGDEYGIRWNDADLGIEWPDGVEPIISDKDSDLPAFADAKYFD